MLFMKNKRLEKPYEVIYVAGNGHSGSTLLDIIIGSDSEAFSSGELNFICREGISKEYCSCGTKIGDCKVWVEIFSIWEKKREISMNEFIFSRSKFERNKKVLVAFRNILSPTSEYLAYQAAVIQLFDAIHEVTKASVIVDSSKISLRIPILRPMGPKVLHICRNFTGVLNSAKKTYRKDLKGGVEQDIEARGSMKTLFDWLVNNFLTEILCLLVESKKVRYDRYTNPSMDLIEVEPILSRIERKEFYSAEHMLAGNKMRLEKAIKIIPDLGKNYNRLSRRQIYIGSWIDRFFWFWH